MYSLLFKSFFRTKIFLVSLALLLTVGVISIFIGKQYLVKQEKTIAAAQVYQEESIEKNVAYHSEDLGLLLYYLRFTLIKRPQNINAISIGQSDVNPLLQAVTIRALEAQKYDTDFENPSLLMSGNLDLGFVIIYLFPLVLIAMTFNLYSEEKELGTWRILAAQTSAKAGFLFKKLLVRILFVFVVLVFLLFLASAILQIPMNANFWAIFVQSVLYVLFWSALCLWMVSLLRNSSFNALALISIWVVLTILIPALVNNYVINAYQVPEALDAMVEQRDGYHEKWDLEKDATMTEFIEAYPQYKNYPVPEDEFSWIWYYGMQYMGDFAAKDTSAEMTEKIILRNTVSEKIALFVPTMHAQLSLNSLAGTDMRSHLDFLKSLTEFHKNLRDGFYTKIFDHKSADAVDWKNHEAKFYEQDYSFSWLKLLLPTLLITLIIAVLAGLNLRKL
ncbi:ABC-2 type transport system permease protein [Flavobacteriaceae bacterium MAR_2009_75]|nr:ABC-2 type transport system permease protein [Flavobacteriaceae bacterium MAR_2009_75]